MARALGSRSSVEAGKENPEDEGETQSYILLTHGKVMPPFTIHDCKNPRRYASSVVCRSESFAKIMDIHMSGPMVKNHVSLKMVLGLIVIRRTTSQSWSQVYRRLSSATPTSLPQESTGSTPIPASIEGERADEQGRGNLSPDPTKFSKPNKKWRVGTFRPRTDEND